MTTQIKKKIDQFKSMQPPSGNEPTRQEAVDSAIHEAVKLAMEVATATFSPVIKSLANELAEAKELADNYKATITHLQDELEATKPSQLPTDFAYSPNLTKQADQLADMQADVQRQQRSELAEWKRKTLKEIAHRQQRIAKETAYTKAVTEGSYAEAMTAITAKRQEVQQNGVDVWLGFSGESCKALYDADSSKLFTFSRLDSQDITILGNDFKVLSADISQINAGNTYKIRRV